MVGIWVVRAIGMHQPTGTISPSVSLAGEILLFLSVMIATATVGRFEGRSFGTYGLPIREDSLRKFVYGTIWGVVPLTSLLLVLRGLGSLEFGGTELKVGTSLRFILVWALVFILTGVFEEFAVRGYPQYVRLSLLRNRLGAHSSRALCQRHHYRISLPRPGRERLKTG